MTELAAKDDEAIELVKEQALDGFNYFTRGSISQFVRRSPLPQPSPPLIR